MSDATSPADKDTFRFFASPEFPEWLKQAQASIAFSTYQLGKIFFVGLKPEGKLGVFERTFNRCMGLWSDTQTLWLASAFQLWRMENMLKPGALNDDGFDRMFIPQEATTTGDIDVHDIFQTKDGRLYFVNTLFSCIGTKSARESFDVVWQPPFISKLAAEDRCHLNGMACDESGPRYVTACARVDQFHGWRDHRHDGGCVIDVQSNEVVAQGLSMPHSPRLYGDTLWMLDSGHGYFGRIDLKAGKFEPLVFCPGYARGLCFIGKYAVVGLSKPRQETFAGLPLDAELEKYNVKPRCGLQVIDLESGKIVQWIQLEGMVEELYDVIGLPGVVRPMAFGLKTDEIRHNVWFQDNGELTRWTAGEGRK